MGNGSPPSCRRAIHQEPRPQCLISPARQFHLPPDEMTRRDLALVVLRLKPACHWPTRKLFIYIIFFTHAAETNQIQSSLHLITFSRSDAAWLRWKRQAEVLASAVLRRHLCLHVFALPSLELRTTLQLLRQLSLVGEKGKGCFHGPPGLETRLCHRVKNRTCSRAHFRKLGWGGWGGDNSKPCHRAGESQRAERFRNRALSVHTGTIDSCWAQMKTYIPKSLSPQSKQIPLRIRSWQWRFTHAAHDKLVSTVWHSSGQVVGKTSQRVKNARRCGNRHIGSQRCIRGGNGILTKFACRWGKTQKKKNTQPELDIFHHRQRQNHW